MLATLSSQKLRKTPSKGLLRHTSNGWYLDLQATGTSARLSLLIANNSSHCLFYVL